jgi:hypothetical protein
VSFHLRKFSRREPVVLFLQMHGFLEADLRGDPKKQVPPLRSLRSASVGMTEFILPLRSGRDDTLTFYSTAVS